MEVTIKLDGFRELDAALNRLPKNIALKALKKSTADGMRVIRDQAAQNLGRKRSVLAMSTSAATGVVKVLLGISKAHWAIKFFETGVKPTTIKIKNKKVLANQSAGIIFGKEITRSQRPRPFLVPAFDSKYNAALEKMKEVLGAQVEADWRK